MCKFHKRHYELVATALQNIHPGSDSDTIDYDARLEMWRDVRAELCQAFAADNGQFKRERFEVACLPGNNVRARSY